MNYKYTLFLVFLILISLLLPRKNIKVHQIIHSKGSKSCNVKVPIPENNIYLGHPCTEKPRQDTLSAVLAFASEPNNKIKKLDSPCQKKEYTWATLDEVRLRVLKLYTELALIELNRRCNHFASNIAKKRPLSATNEKRTLRPFHFKFIQIINATSSVDKHGNSRWRVDLMVEEQVLHFSQRLLMDFTITVILPTKKSKSIATCAEYTSFPFPKYPLGYPNFDQMIPLPTQIISTGPGMVLSNKGINADYPRFDKIYLNRVWLENSDLALGTELPMTLNCETAPAINDTTLPSSKYPRKRLERKDIIFPEKDYADCLENKKMGVNTDIYNDYTLKPKNYDCAKPENTYHFQGSTETYNESMLPPTHPNGWIQPAVIRNKWPRLWSEPRDRYAWPCAQQGLCWDNKGIMNPQAKYTDKCDGTRWSTEQQPRAPQYWPTITGLPVNDGPNNWLFDNLRGGNATDGASHPTR
jgi:hypothetical protein